MRCSWGGGGGRRGQDESISRSGVLVQSFRLLWFGDSGFRV